MRVALLLRKEGLEYLIICLKTAVILQKHLRRFTRQSAYKRLQWRRRMAALQITTYARKTLAKRVAAYFRLQQISEYEQLWDDENGRVYFYHNTTGTSSFTAPAGPYRPLVRDLYSDTLIQAWPQLEDASRYMMDINHDDGSLLKSNSSVLCCVCKERQSVRMCHDCTTPSSLDDAALVFETFCFPCYSAVHSHGKENHSFTDIKSMEEEVPSPNITNVSLKCSQCEFPATR